MVRNSWKAIHVCLPVLVIGLTIISLVKNVQAILDLNKFQCNGWKFTTDLIVVHFDLQQRIMALR